MVRGGRREWRGRPFPSSPASRWGHRPPANKESGPGARPRSAERWGRFVERVVRLKPAPVWHRAGRCAHAVCGAARGALRSVTAGGAAQSLLESCALSAAARITRADPAKGALCSSSGIFLAKGSAALERLKDLCKEGKEKAHHSTILQLYTQVVHTKHVNCLLLVCGRRVGYSRNWSVSPSMCGNTEHIKCQSAFIWFGRWVKNWHVGHKETWRVTSTANNHTFNLLLFKIKDYFKIVILYKLSQVCACYCTLPSD